MPVGPLAPAAPPVPPGPAAGGTELEDLSIAAWDTSGRLLLSEFAIYQTLGIEARLATPAEIVDACPIVDPGGLLGGLFDPHEGAVDPHGTTHAFAIAARKHGADVILRNRVTGLRPHADGWLVETEHGTVVAQHVVNAGGLWARRVGRMVGVDLPLTPMQHHYLITEDLPELLARADEMPCVTDLEGCTYLQQERKGVILGVYERNPRHWHAVQPTAVRSETPFRQATRADRHGIFRLYCRAVPEMVRRHEAPTQQDWRAVLDSFECTHGYVLDGPAGFSAWVGAGERENHILIDDPDDAVVQAALDLVELRSPRHGTLVVAEHQFPVESAAIARGYTAMGVRLMCARRLALMNTLKEVVAVTVEPMALPQ